MKMHTEVSYECGFCHRLLSGMESDAGICAHCGNESDFSVRTVSVFDEEDD